MASKKLSAVSPVRPRIASERAGEVRGPVATMTLSQSSGGRPAISPRLSSTSGWLARRSVTAREKPSRSTARAPPAGRRCASADARISEPARRISSCSRPTALFSASSERSELEQHQLGAVLGLVRLGRAQRAHLVQHDGDAGLGEVPGGLAAGEAGADDVDGMGLGSVMGV